ncbi:MAG: alpha/beta hydrolase, partial [Rubrivivax sp.]|nr:alpha/beta hydrolase [Rubrivivax sp.]
MDLELTRHAATMREFFALLETDPSAARRLARLDVQRTRSLPPADSRRGDALERLAHVQHVDEDWPALVDTAQGWVDARRLQGQAQLLALALGVLAIALVGTDRADEADDVLHEQLVLWRQVLPTDALQLAAKLESYALLVQQGFQRTEYVIELLREAVAIRQRHANTPPAPLAQALQQLALLEAASLQEDLARQHQEQALVCLQQALAAEPPGAQRDEMLAGCVQSRLMLAGLALAQGDDDGTLRHLQSAADTPVQDPVARAEYALIAAQITAWFSERHDDLDGALEAWQHALDISTQQINFAPEPAPPAARRPWDPLTLGDIALAMADLSLRRHDLPHCASALDLAAQVLGEQHHADVLLMRSRLRSAQGDAAGALRCYRRALRLRKESAGEVLVQWGTPRALDDPASASASASASSLSATSFSHRLGSKLHLGRAHVLVPGGVLSDAASLPLWDRSLPAVGRATRPEALHLRSLRGLSPSAFGALAARQQRAAQTQPDAALVFVHGFNVSFEEALQRAAQLRRDLNFDGPLFVFSWPSRGQALRYFADRQTALASVDALAEFLLAVERACTARRIHVLAHSMGNRVLLPALLRVVARPMSALSQRLGEIVMAAPAVPMAEFAPALDRLLALKVKRLTLYASHGDLAMKIGRLAERAVLAGHTTEGEPLVHPWLVSIDITAAGSPAFGA